MIRTRTIPLLTLLALAIAAVAPPAWAELIRLRNGNTIEGIIQDRREGKVYILTGTGLVGLPADAIDDRATDAAASQAGASNVRVRLQAGQFLSALAEVQATLDDAAAPPERLAELRQVLASEHALVHAALGRLRPAEADASVELLKQLATPAGEGAAPDPSLDPFRAALADWQRSLGRLDDSIDTLIAIQGELGAAWQGLTDRAARLLMEDILKRANERDEASLEAPLAALGRINPELGTQAAGWAWARHAWRARRKGEYEAALKLYRDRVAATHPALARNRAADTLREADLRLGNAEDWKRLVDLYEVYGLTMLGDRINTPFARALERAGHASLALGDTDGASLYFVRVESARGGNADQLLDLAEFERRRIGLQREDILAHFELGLWGAERGLFAKAREIFSFCMETEQLGEAARLQREALDRAEALSLFERATAALTEKRPLEALDLCDDFLKRFELSNMRDQVRQLRDNAKRELEQERNQRPFRADSLYQQAEREYLLQKPESALKLLDRVQVEYADTPAALAATKLKRQVLHRIYGDAFESGAPLLSDETARENAEEREDIPSALAADALGESALRDELLALSQTLRPYLPAAERLP